MVSRKHLVMHNTLNIEVEETTSGSPPVRQEQKSDAIMGTDSLKLDSGRMEKHWEAQGAICGTTTSSAEGTVNCVHRYSFLEIFLSPFIDFHSRILPVCDAVPPKGDQAHPVWFFGLVPYAQRFLQILRIF